MFGKIQHSVYPIQYIPALFTFEQSRIARLNEYRAVEEKPRLIRWPFDARAEIYAENSTRILTKVKEISLHGCYLEYVALSKGTHVLLKIFDGSDFFEANANVIFAQPGTGLGLAFRDVKPYFLPILQKWLTQAMKNREA